MTAALAQHRQVRLFRNGRNQAIRIPREFELPGKEAILHQKDGRLIIESAQSQSLLSFLETCEPLDLDFPAIDPAPRLDDVDI